jgi:hypothetical protein
MSEISDNPQFVWIISGIAGVFVISLFLWSQKKQTAIQTNERMKIVRSVKDGDEAMHFQFRDFCFEDTQVIDPFLDVNGRWRIAETYEFVVCTKPNISGVFDFVIGSPYIPEKSLRGPFIGFMHKDNPRKVHIYAANLEWKGDIIDQNHIIFIDPKGETRTWIRESRSPYPKDP